MKPMACLMSPIVFAISLPAIAQSPPPACPFSSSELQSIFGVAFADGKAGLELTTGATIIRDCRYESKNYSLRVGTTVYVSDTAGAKAAASYLAGKMVPIPGDPDGAVFQEGQGDASNPALHYARGNVAVQLRVMGIYYADPKTKVADMHAMQQKLARVRRVP